jgi:hypothetical protein
MDTVAKGMSQAGRHPNECCTKQEGLMSRMAHSFQGIAAKVGHFLKGKPGTRSGSTR